MLLPIACLLGIVPPVVQDPTPRILVDEPLGIARAALTLGVSIPWPRGAHAEVEAVPVGAVVGHATTLLRWKDGSVRLSRVHVRLPVPAGGGRFDVGAPCAPPAPAGPATAPPPPAPVAAVAAELVDAWGRRYRADLRTADWRDDPRLSTPAMRVCATRLPLLRRPEAGPPVVCFEVECHAEIPADGGPTALTVVLRNDPGPGLPVLGPARLRSFSLRAADPALAMAVRHADALRVPPVGDDARGHAGVDLLGPAPTLYLGDRTGVATRVDLWRRDGEAAAERRRAALGRPLAWPDPAWVRHTGAFGAHGGPGPAADADPDRTDLAPLTAPTARGRFFDFGDPADANLAGMPRHGSAALLRLVSAPTRERHQRAALAVLQQTLRPTLGLAPRCPDATAALRQGLSPLASLAPHGFMPPDYEHLSLDLLFDWFWWTADPLALAELRRQASGVPALLERVPFATARGEGWCLRATALAAWATGDRGPFDAVLARFRREVLPGIGAGEDAAHAVAQPPDPRALGPAEPFDAPWQMGALVLGLHAAWRLDGGDDLRDALLTVARRLVRHGIVAGVGLRPFVSARDPRVAAAPWPGPNGALLGATVIPALVVAHGVADSDTDRSRLARAADFLVERMLREPTLPPGAGRWLHLHRDQLARRR